MSCNSDQLVPAGGGGLTYFPPVTVVGQLNKSGANALQKDRSGGIYTKIKDDEAVQDIPFKIFYRK